VTKAARAVYYTRRSVLSESHVTARSIYTHAYILLSLRLLDMRILFTRITSTKKTIKSRFPKSVKKIEAESPRVLQSASDLDWKEFIESFQ